MIGETEVAARFAFYEAIFTSRDVHQTPFPDRLWPLCNYNEKIRGLTERGFKDPQKMVTSLPAILGYSFDNIDRKLKLCRRLRVNPKGFIDCTIVFIGMSMKHYVPILRKCRQLNLEATPRNVFRVYRKKEF